MDDSNRNIIRLEELEEEKKDKGKYLSDSELKSKLESYKGRIPAVIVNDLYDILKGKKITEEQLEKIVSRVEGKLKERVEVNVDDIAEKIDKIEKALSTFMRKVEDRLAEKMVAEAYGSSSEASESAVGKEEAEEKKEQELAAQQPLLDAREVVETARPKSVRLTSIPESTRSMMFLLKWIEFMIERVGYDGLSDLLDYYVDIGWISEDVMFEVLKYSKGIRLYHEKSDWRPVGYMTVQDHIMSLLFIEALRTGKMNKDLLLDVERQVYRIKKEVSEINGL